MVLILTAITCGLILGEAIALLIGSFIMRRKTFPWLDKKNLILLILDIVLAPLIIISLPALNYLPLLVFYSALILLIGSLLFRTREYILHTENKFCENRVLYVINNILLTGLLIVLTMSAVKIV